MGIKHTPEPWDWETDESTDRGHGPAIVGSSGMPYIGRMDSGDHDDDKNHANAKRIIACVNACAGFPDPTTVIELLEVAKEAHSYWNNTSGQLPKFVGKLRSVIYRSTIH